jgi:bacterioferritin
MYGKLHDAMKKRAIDEMKHAEILIARILFMEGRPVVSQLGAIHIGIDVEDIHKKDWESEHKTIGDYNAAIKISQDAGDSGTREILESIIADEETHIDWIEGQRDQIAQMGVATYLGRQID